MKKIFAFLFVIVFLLPGCSFDMQVLKPTPVPVEPTVRTIIAPKGTLTVDEIVPNALPTTTDPQFYEAHIAPEQSGEAGRSRFPAGTKQLFAVWNYRNMREGLSVKREWYLDDRLWLTREEPWDFATYGASGIMQDVSIYDLDAGLPSGKYKLIVFIEGVVQPIGRKVIESSAETYLGFEILPVNEATSPNGQWKATSLVERLVLTNANGNQSDLFTGREIAAVAWFPDSQHLLVVDRDRSKQVAAGLSVGVRDDLWIVDISSLKTNLVHASDTRMSGNTGLVLSPDGRYIASIEGSGFGDACFVDTRMIFFEIAGDYQSVKAIEQEQFTGLPGNLEGVIFPSEAGIWETNTQFIVPLSITCTSGPAFPTPYVFDLQKLTATKK